MKNQPLATSQVVDYMSKIGKALTGENGLTIANELDKFLAGQPCFLVKKPKVIKMKNFWMTLDPARQSGLPTIKTDIAKNVIKAIAPGQMETVVANLVLCSSETPLDSIVIIGDKKYRIGKCTNPVYVAKEVSVANFIEVRKDNLAIYMDSVIYSNDQDCDPAVLVVSKGTIDAWEIVSPQLKSPHRTICQLFEI
ncbi:MAG: hypothetical protein KBC17_03090 [Candidatus Pacebacteria bacterium]|nr:hypothetical protein [Candidatus Paceibacterota bacterium]